MFERFTEPARQVVVMAQTQARELGHSYIGTEHLLLGLLGVSDGAAARTLEAQGLSLEHARASVVELVGQGAEAPGGQIPFTPRAKKVLELALREALALHHNYIGTEHILLGLLREPQGPAIEILGVAGLTPEQIRSEVLRLLPPGERDPQGRSATARAAALATAAPGFSVRPNRGLRRLLMAAAGRALADQREEFGLEDLLAVVDAAAPEAENRSPAERPGSEAL
ncbi:Clp protease N-terminal domain-containing protein [Conexibacter sp. S30A1]|uniref:Clp protease N-terminal domain-containing protein n=1 Tax=Conexibacter sp. S30A1 TaxID=2937800 RepID=UPI00273A7491|nr:Clp protease N-terminal domain-containing protein [Conexibacter sp. S30A1]